MADWGSRRLKDIATPAAVAAKLNARPKTAELSAALTTAGLTTDDQLLKHLDTQLRVLHTDFEAQLDLTEHGNLPTLIKTNCNSCTRGWENRRHGRTIQAPQPVAPRHGLAPDDHTHDPTDINDPDATSPCTTNRAQCLLCQLFDNTQARILHLTLDDHEAYDDIDRLAELRHPQDDHQWLYHIDPSTGAA